MVSFDGECGGWLIIGDALGGGPYGRAGGPDPTSALPTHPPGARTRCRPPRQKNPSATPGATYGATP